MMFLIEKSNGRVACAPSGAAEESIVANIAIDRRARRPNEFFDTRRIRGIGLVLGPAILVADRRVRERYDSVASDHAALGVCSKGTSVVRGALRPLNTL